MTHDEIIAAICKPLVWQPDSLHNSHPDRMRAVMPCGFGDYTIAGSRNQDKWQWYRNGYFVPGHALHSPMPQDAALAAAEADHRARIAAALNVELIAALVSEAKVVCEWQIEEGRGRFLTLEDALAAFLGASHE